MDNPEYTKSYIEIKHSEMVRVLVKKPEAILETLTEYTVDLLHGGIGVSSEAGELLDAIKKLFVYNRPLDLKNVEEELGDLEFYMEQVRQRTGITREQTLAANMDKLADRYKDYKYTDQRAHERADKKESYGTFLCGRCVKEAREPAQFESPIWGKICNQCNSELGN